MLISSFNGRAGGSLLVFLVVSMLSEFVYFVFQVSFEKKKEELFEMVCTF